MLKLWKGNEKSIRHNIWQSLLLQMWLERKRGVKKMKDRVVEVRLLARALCPFAKVCPWVGVKRTCTYCLHKILSETRVGLNTCHE